MPVFTGSFCPCGSTLNGRPLFVVEGSREGWRIYCTNLKRGQSPFPYVTVARLLLPSGVSKPEAGTLEYLAAEHFIREGLKGAPVHGGEVRIDIDPVTWRRAVENRPWEQTDEIPTSHHPVHDAPSRAE